MNPELTGVILAGGASRRFGSNKALAPWDGRPLIEKIAGDVAALFSKTLLVTNTPEEFSFLGWDTVADLRCGQGPLAGLEAALAAISTPYLFLTGCDLPCLSEKVIRHLIDHRGDFRAVIPSGPAGPEPLCAIYRRDILDEVRGLLDRGERRISLLADLPGSLVLTADEIRRVDPAPNIFANANRPEDLAAIKAEKP